jgi:hypothetical protein
MKRVSNDAPANKLSDNSVSILEHASDGYATLCATSYLDEEIKNDAKNATKNREYSETLHSLITVQKSAIGINRAWFSSHKFCKLLGEADHTMACQVVCELDNSGISVKDALSEGGPCDVSPDLDTAEDQATFAIKEIVAICAVSVQATS